MKHILRLFKMAKPWAKYFVLAITGMFGAAAINLYAPLITRKVIRYIESGLNESVMRFIILQCGLLLGLYLVRAFMNFLHQYFSHKASWGLVAHVRAVLYDHYQKLSMKFFKDKQTGGLMSRVISDTSTFETLFAHAVPDLVSYALTFIGVFIILMMINPVLTLYTCIPLPFIGISSFILRRMRRFFRMGQERNSELGSLLQDNFSGIKEIQLFNKQESESSNVRIVAEHHANTQIRAMFNSAVMHPIVELVTSLGTIIVLVLGSLYAYRSGFEISELVTFILYLAQFYAPVAGFARILEDLQRGIAGAERVFEVIDTEPEIKDSPNATDIGRLSGELTFSNVSFSYEDELPVLKDISFSVDPGDMLAIVGPTGEGKTTMSSLIARFYDPKEGIVSMDGHDLKEITLDSLRRNLSFVFQDVFLFNGSIRDNISYAVPDVSEQDIIAAAKTACIHDFITSLPDGYDTQIGERGTRLSGGQKQRIAIARAILRNSPVLVLDEATSAVDTETEASIQDAISNIAGSRTLIVIAHRLSTIRKANKILVLSGGSLAESGTHDELMERKGIYYKLCTNQQVIC